MSEGSLCVDAGHGMAKFSTCSMPRTFLFENSICLEMFCGHCDFSKFSNSMFQLNLLTLCLTVRMPYEYFAMPQMPCRQTTHGHRIRYLESQN